MIKGEKNNIDLSFEDMQFLLALYETQSLTQTAGDMRLSMGAASRRLSHVREVFGDELFVRSGLSMLPTSRMRELRDRLAELVDQTRRLLNPEPLELHEMNRVVRFISADNGIATLLSAAVERFYNAVPNSRFAIEPLDVRVLERLRANEADMAFFPATELPPDFHSLRIYRSKKGILVRDGHPVIEAYEKAGVMTWELLNRWPAVCVTAGMKDGGAKSVEGRRVGVVLPYFLTVPYVVARTDFTFEGPLITLRRFMMDSQFQFRILPMPEESGPFEPRLVWHHCSHTDPFLQWVRGLVVDAARSEARLLGVIDTSEEYGALLDGVEDGVRPVAERLDGDNGLALLQAQDALDVVGVEARAGDAGEVHGGCGHIDGLNLGAHVDDHAARAHFLELFGCPGGVPEFFNDALAEA